MLEMVRRSGRLLVAEEAAAAVRTWKNRDFDFVPGHELRPRKGDEIVLAAPGFARKLKVLAVGDKAIVVQRTDTAEKGWKRRTVPFDVVETWAVTERPWSPYLDLDPRSWGTGHPGCPEHADWTGRARATGQFTATLGDITYTVNQDDHGVVNLSVEVFGEAAHAYPVGVYAAKDPEVRLAARKLAIRWWQGRLPRGPKPPVLALWALRRAR